MKLYGSYTSPFTRHCRIALIESGLEGEFVETLPTNKQELPPTLRVPFLSDGDVMLHESSSILKYLREKSGQSFMQDLETYDLFGLVNAIMDSTVNIFQFERAGLKVADNAYLQRQDERVGNLLGYLNSMIGDRPWRWDDAMIRLSIFVDWATFRRRIDFTDYGNLRACVERARKESAFEETGFPAGA